MHVLRARLQEGLQSKMKRGELQMRLPARFVYNAAGTAFSIRTSSSSTA
jgi:hypothetical protein